MKFISDSAFILNKVRVLTRQSYCQTDLVLKGHRKWLKNLNLKLLRRGLRGLGNNLSSSQLFFRLDY